MQSSIYSQVAYSDNTFSAKDITGLNSVAVLTELKDFGGNNNQQIDVYLYYCSQVNYIILIYIVNR